MNMLQTLCVKCVERSEAFGFKGKKREDAAFEFMVGAGSALEAIDHPEAAHVNGVIAMIIAVRGYFEIARIASEAQKEKAA